MPNEIMSVEDDRAFKAFMYRLRNTPRVLIAQKLQISERQVYRDIERGKELFGFDAKELLPMAAYEAGDLGWEARMKYDEAKNAGNVDEQHYWFTECRNLVNTKINAAKGISPQHEGFRATQTVEVTGEHVDQILEKLARKQSLNNTSTEQTAK